MKCATLTLIVRDILRKRGVLMCDEVHPGSDELCELGELHTGLHETEDGDVWGCEASGEHTYYAIEGQRYPVTNCIICGAPYAQRIKERRRVKHRIRRGTE